MSIDLQVGELKGTVKALENSVKSLEITLTDLDKKLDTVIEKLAVAKGGWKGMTLILTIASSVGAFIPKLFTVLTGG